MKTALELAMERAERLQPIPPITDPMGRNWDQPDRKLIEVDGKHALMDRTSFEQLKEYSSTIPTGVYPGKMWKRHDGEFDPRCRPQDCRWLLCWYGPVQDDRCGINFREIILA